MNARSGVVDMVLYCPHCNTQHLDEPAPGTVWANNNHPGASEPWTNPPHKSHLCRKCGHIWRPSDTPTNGVLRTNSGKDMDTRPRGWTREQVTELLNRTVTAPLIHDPNNLEHGPGYVPIDNPMRYRKG